MFVQVGRESSLCNRFACQPLTHTHIHTHTHLHSSTLTPTGQFPLHIAAQNGNVAIVELLLQNEAVLDLSDANGMTPIHLASIMGAREALGVMVKLAGAAVLSLPDASGVTPLMYACAYGNETLTKYLLKKKVSKW